VSRARRLLSSVLVAALLGGCAIAIPPPRATVPEEARRAIDLLVARWHEFTDLRALADVAVDKGGQKQRLTGVLLARAPGSVRFEALSPFGQPFLLVTVNDGHLTAYNAATNEAVVGDANAETTARLLNLPLDPDDLVAVLSGRTVPPKDLRIAEFQPPDEMGRSITLIGALHEQRVWMDFTTGVVRQLQITGGRATATVTYLRDDAGALGGFDVTAGAGYVTGSVRYRNLTLGGGIEPERFVLTLPKDAKTQSIR
jgi:outer membrane lipoprotein-sorting protein